MNFLAHAYLSFDDAEVLTGNLISDFVKGRKKFDYPPRILAGIDLHRAIDAFTDGHPVTKEAANYFRPFYGRYAMAFMDVVYDHFLALQIASAGKEKLKDFSTGVYKKLDLFEYILPQQFRNIYPSMKQHDWLFNYLFVPGIERSFQGLVHRAAYISSSEAAISIFTGNYPPLKRAFDSFFPELMAFSVRNFADIH